MGEPISKERADLIKSLQAENKKLRDKEPDDDLTIAYLYGYSKGKEFSLAENKRLQVTKDEALKDICRTKSQVFDALEDYIKTGAPISVVEDAYSNYIIAWNSLKSQLKVQESDKNG